MCVSTEDWLLVCCRASFCVSLWNGQYKDKWVLNFQSVIRQPNAVADPEGGHGGAPSKIGQNPAKLAHFLPILASMPP